MNLKDWFDLFKSAADTKTAYVLVAMGCFYIGTRLQKKLNEFALRSDLKNHRQAVHLELVQAKEEIKEDLLGFHNSMKEHEKKDDARFETWDHAFLPQFKMIDDKFNKASLDLAKIKGALKIEGE